MTFWCKTKFCSSFIPPTHFNSFITSMISATCNSNLQLVNIHKLKTINDKHWFRTFKCNFLFTRQCLMYNFLFPHPINDRVHAKLKFCRFCNARKSSKSVFKEKGWEVPYVDEMKYVKCLNLSILREKTGKCSLSLHWKYSCSNCMALSNHQVVNIQWSCAKQIIYWIPKALRQSLWDVFLSVRKWYIQQTFILCMEMSWKGLLRWHHGNYLSFFFFFFDWMTNNSNS